MKVILPSPQQKRDIDEMEMVFGLKMVEQNIEGFKTKEDFRDKVLDSANRQMDGCVDDMTPPTGFALILNLGEGGGQFAEISGEWSVYDIKLMIKRLKEMKAQMEFEPLDVDEIF